MSYCRWSSDFGECDVYVYEDVNGGWTTHVAGRRLKHCVPDEIRELHDKGDYVAAWEAQRRWRESLPCDWIPTKKLDGSDGPPMGLPKDSEYFDLSEIGEEAGESYNDPTPGQCAERLRNLKTRGFNVPQYAIDALGRRS